MTDSVPVSPAGIPNPPGLPDIIEIPRPHESLKPAIRIVWTPPLYTAGLDQPLYQAEWVAGFQNVRMVQTNDTYADGFAGNGIIIPKVTVIDPDTQEDISESSRKQFVVVGSCTKNGKYQFCIP